MKIIKEEYKIWEYKYFGFDLPEKLSKLVQYSISKAGSYSKFRDYFDELAGLLFRKNGKNDYRLIPEFFLIGAMGVDGVLYGSLNFFPEIDQNDYPFASFDPGEKDRILIDGKITLDALKEMFYLSFEVIESDEDEEKVVKNYWDEIVYIFKNVFNLNLTYEDYEKENDETTSNNLSVNDLYIPENYELLYLTDEISVITEKKYFNKDIDIEEILKKEIKKILEISLDEFNKNFFGTSLFLTKYVFKEFTEGEDDNKDLLDKILKIYSENYKKLDREILANKIKKWKRKEILNDILDRKNFKIEYADLFEEIYRIGKNQKKV